MNRCLKKFKNSNFLPADSNSDSNFTFRNSEDEGREDEIKA